MLLNPSPNDWLMYSRTYDAFRDSPLKQINKSNVRQLRMAWVRGLEEGVTETIPIVHDGVMYVIAPGGFVDALDATNGDLIWEYKRPFKNPQVATNERTKALAIYEDMVYFTAADGYVVALDARTGQSSLGDFQDRYAKYIRCARRRRQSDFRRHVRQEAATAASSKRTTPTPARKLWRFFTVAHPGDPGYASWNGADNSQSMASTWGLPGSFDPVRNVLYWGVANPMPDQRMASPQRQSGWHVALDARGPL